MTSPLRFPQAVPPASESKLRGRTYSSGFSDALGDRLLAHGAGDEPILEVLEFKPELSDSSDFEKALRARVDVLRPITHASLAAIHSVERPDGMGLCLVSEHIEGRRLSELTPANLGHAFALDVIRTVTPALCALNQAGVGVAHGALSAERIVVAADGRLVVVEQVLGWAIESLRLPRRRLNEFGIVVSSDPVRFDGRTDTMQLGFLALSLFLKRRLDPADCPVRVPALLDGSADESGSLMLPARLRVWLERALQVGHKSFKTVDEAADELDELGDDTEVPLDDTDALLEFPSEDEIPAAPIASAKPATSATPATPVKPATPAKPTTPAAAIAPATPTAPAKPAAPAAAITAATPTTLTKPAAPPTPASSPKPAAAVLPKAAPPRDTAKVEAPEAPQTPPAASELSYDRLRRLGVWVLVAVSLIAMGEAVALVLMSFNQGPVDPRSNLPPLAHSSAPAAGVESTTPSTPPALNPANPQTAPGPAAASVQPPATATAPPASAIPERRFSPAPAPTPQAPRLFPLTITSPLQLQVFADGRLVGTTPMTTNLREGAHEIEAVNELLEFRHTQAVRVGNGQPQALRIVAPAGQINLNATPWAEVTIDGVSVGQTPIANYSLSIGRHEIVFRHPQLGLRRQSVLVKAGTPLRVFETFLR